MPGPWKEWKSKNSFPTSFHRPLEISQTTRDFPHFHSPPRRFTFPIQEPGETMMTMWARNSYRQDGILPAVGNRRLP